MFTVGDPGSGKSFSSKQNFIRSTEQERDRTGVILEPLNDWTGVAEALDAKRVTVGGKLGLNPLGIREMPERVQRTIGEDATPFNEKFDDAMSFLTNFFALRGISLGDRRTTLELDQCAVKQFRRLNRMDEEWVEEFGLNYAQIRYEQDAVPGNEDAGFPEALVAVDGEWRGLTAEAMPTEEQVIDFDPLPWVGRHCRGPPTYDQPQFSVGVECVPRLQQEPSDQEPRTAISSRSTANSPPRS